MKTVFVLILIGFLSVTACAQLNFDFQKNKFLIKGIVVDRQNGLPVPMAVVRFNNTTKGVSANGDGEFSLYVYKRDTLLFSSMGYMDKTVIVTDVDSSDYYTLQVSLIQDFIRIKEVTIYPFRTKEEFIDAFMEAKNVNKVLLPGIAPPKYSNITPRAKFTNPVSFIYERAKKRSVANPDFKP